MSQVLSLPVDVAPEAAARVAELGFHQIVDELFAQAIRILPGVQSLRLTLVPSYEMDDIPWLVLECHGDRAEPEAREAIVAWYTWRAETFPFEVARHFMLSWVHLEEAHAGREFLDLAREIVGNGADRHWRGAHIHAYYALFLESREALTRWGSPSPSLHSVHHHVRSKLTFAGDKELKSIGIVLDYLSQGRSWASYQLGPHGRYSSEAAARQSIQSASDAIALLDALEANPARLTVAVTSIRP